MEIDEEKLCKFCGLMKSHSHHCSGKNAYNFGKKEAIDKIFNANLIHPDDDKIFKKICIDLGVEKNESKN